MKLALSFPSFICGRIGSRFAHVFAPINQIKTNAIDFTNFKGETLPPEEVKVSEIKGQFLEDLRQFAVGWSESDTEELILQLPRSALREGPFGFVEGIARNSSLVQRFSITVVLLRSVIIHHFNFIRTKHFGQVPRSHWDGMRSLVCWEDATESVLKGIVSGRDDSYGHISIDRHAAHQLVIASRRDLAQSIVS
jgi:hypothetical protein